MAHARGVLAGFTLVLSLAALAAPSGQIPPQTPPTIRVPGFEQSQNWLRLAQSHEIGSLDSAARTVAGWPQLVLQQTLDDAQVIRLLVALAATRGVTSNRANLSADLHGRRLTFDQLPPLLGIDPPALSGPFDPAALAAPGSPARRAIAQLMMRVAMLHTDIAFASGDMAEPIGNPRFTAMAVQLRDGREVLVANRSVHYGIAREAVAMVLSASAGTVAARQWYYGTMAYLQHDRNYAALMPHVETARAVMPADAHVWLASGAAYENLAAPVVQVAVGSTANARIEPPKILLARADTMLRRALSLDPDRAESLLRLGRVLELTGRHEDAAAMIATAESRLSAPRLKYYAALFAGRAAQAMGKNEEARDAYVRAMALFPRAQSPRLSLAQMAWSSPSQSLAQSGVRTLFVTAAGDPNSDPWWTYDISLVTDWQDLVREMQRAAREVAEAK